jgi:hypothetical protein
MIRLLVVALMLMASPALAATYYVSNTGSDSANGTSRATPWQTVNKVNTSSFSAGDSVLLKAGGVWSEGLVAPSTGSSGSPVTFSSYSTGAQPELRGGVAKNSDSDWVQDPVGLLGDLSQWTSKTDTASKISATTAASRTGGGYGFQLTNNATSTVAYLTKTFTATAAMDLVFYVKFPNADASWTDGTYVYMSAQNGAVDRLEIYIKRNGTNMQVYSRFDVGGAADTMNYTTLCTTTDITWHKIEVQMKFDSPARELSPRSSLAARWPRISGPRASTRTTCS